MIKSRQFGGAVHVARMGDMTCHTKFYPGKLKEETAWGNLGYRVDGRIRLKFTFQLRCEVLGPSEHGNGPSV